jgi:hypothetical protein
MTPRSNLPPEELLSACHDGELTSAERTEAERLLAENPALRETLDDYRELTSVLQSLPRPQAPAKLQADVLKRVQATRPTTAARPARRIPWLWGISLAATAAVLAVMVRGRLASTGPEAVATNAETAQATDEAAAGARFAAPAAETVASADRVTSFGDSVELRPLPAPRSGPGGGRAESMAGAAAPTAPPSANFSANGVAASPPSPAGAPVPAVTMTGPTLPRPEALASRLALDPLNPPAATEVLSHVFESGDETMIVEFEVVNVDQTSQDMLVLLRQRGIGVMSAADDGPAEPPASHAQTLTTEGARPLVALYVQATDQQLAAVMEDLLSRVAIADGAAYNTALAGPDLAPQLDRFVELYGGSSGPRRERMAKTVPPARQSHGEAPLPAQPIVVGVSPPSVDAPIAGEATTPAQNRQGGVRMSLTPEAYRQIETQNQLADEAPLARPEVAAGAASRAEVPLPLDAADATNSAKPAAESPDDAKDDAGVRQMLIVLKAPMRE